MKEYKCVKFTGHYNGAITCFEILLITYNGNKPVTYILTIYLLEMLSLLLVTYSF